MTRGNSSALFLRRSQLFTKHTLWYPPHEKSRAKLLLMLLLILQLLSQNSRKPISHDKILWQCHTVRGLAHYQYSVLPASDHTVEFLWLIMIKSVAQNKSITRSALFSYEFSESRSVETESQHNSCRWRIPPQKNKSRRCMFQRFGQNTVYIWVILRCWGNSSMVCQQNSDAL